MPIRSVVEIQARRAAAAAREHNTNAVAAFDPPPPPAPATAIKPVSETQPKRRGHAVKDERGKWLPTGDKGWCRAPVKNQFQKNGPGGPGRPKGSVSQDSLLKKHLSQKRRVRIDGKDRKVANRELLVMSTVKDALEGKSRDARKYMLSEAARIYAEDKGASGGAPAELNAADQLSLEEYEAELRRQIREEVMRELGIEEGDKE